MKGLCKTLTKEFLTEAYKTKSARKIAKELGCSDTQVRCYLRKFGIAIRPSRGKQPGAGRPLGAKDSYIRNIEALKANLSSGEYKEYKKKKAKEWYSNNKERSRKSGIAYRRTHPWYSHCRAAKRRCNSPKCRSYKFYGGRGIKFLMTHDDFKFLWFRDKAYLMKEPSIDRKESDGNYELSNCQFLELKDNKKKQRFHNQYTIGK